MIDMRINLGSGDIGVAEHHLHGPQIGAMSKKMCCEGVAQHMRGDVFADTSCDRKFLEDLPEAQPCHAAAAISDKEVVASLATQNMGTPIVEIVLDPFLCRFPKRDQALFTAFPHNPDKTGVEVAGDQRQLNQFRHP